MADLRPITVYLDDETVSKLDEEARETGRSGVSSQIRWLIVEHYRGMESPRSGGRGLGGSSR